MTSPTASEPGAAPVGASSPPTPATGSESSPARIRPNPERTRPSFALVQWTVRFLNRLLFRLEIHGAEHLPPRGAVFIASTHTSFIDPPTVGSFLRRESWFLSRDGILRVPLLGRLCSHLNAYPIRRGAGDRDALRICREILRAGWPLVFFPEGTRSSDGRLGKIQGGFVMVLEKVPGVPILPVVFQDSHKALPRGAILPRPRKVHMYVGPTFSLPERLEDESTREWVDRCTGELERRWRELGAK